MKESEEKARKIKKKSARKRSRIPHISGRTLIGYS